jgi:TolB protein
MATLILRGTTVLIVVGCALIAVMRPLGHTTPNGGLIAYTSDLPQSDQQTIYLMDMARRLHYPLKLPLIDGWHPDWSPDGETVLFTLNFRIFSFNLPTQTVRQYTRLYGAMPVWSPDGAWIAFATHRDDDNYSLFRLDAACATVVACEASREPLVADLFVAHYPTWSPGGDDLLYNGGGPVLGYHLYSLVDESRQFITLSRTLGKANWSPDGERIVFAADVQGNDELFIMDMGSGQQQRITNTPAINERFPAFSANGTQIVFTARAHDHLQLFLMDVDGSNRRQITFAPSDALFPAWQPQ